MNLRTEAEIMRGWPPDNKTLVTIVCPAYNHEKYIEEAIKGFLIQETNFPFEIIIHDDASADNTPKIIQQYEKQYLKIIRPIYQTENQYSKKIKPWSDIAFPLSRGKYIAICEGDDYWTDPLKLQKQVDFLEKNDQYGLAHGDCNFYFQEKGRWKYRANKNLTNNNIFTNKEEIFYQLIDASYKIRTPTVIFRKELLGKIKPNEITFMMGDTPMWLDFSQHTKFRYFNEVFAVYRIIGESSSRSKNIVKQKRFQLSMAEMRIYYSRKYGYPITPNLKTRYNKALLTYRLFDTGYKELYPLIEPTFYQKLRSQAIKHGLLRQFFLTRYFISKYLRFLKKYLTVSN